MAPRTGQLDEISEKIGELKGSVGAIDRYVHEHVHGVNNLSQKLDAMALEQARRHEALKVEVSSQIKEGLDAFRAELRLVSERVDTLERKSASEDGSRSVWKWLIATLLALAAVIASAWGHK